MREGARRLQLVTGERDTGIRFWYVRRLYSVLVSLSIRDKGHGSIPAIQLTALGVLALIRTVWRHNPRQVMAGLHE